MLGKSVKKASLYIFRDRDRIDQNNKLVKTIIDINNRKSQYVDILEQRKDG